MKKTFYMIDSRDSGTAFASILFAAGYEQIIEASNAGKANFLLYDLNRYRNRVIRDQFRSKPQFIFPHTPFSWWMWDGLYRAHPVSCNFVGTEAAKTAMKAYGYKYRVEVCGFSRCSVKPWKETEGKVLLYAPNHPITAKHMIRRQDQPVTARTFRHILKIAPSYEKVIVRYGHSLETSEIWDPELPNVEFQLSDLKTVSSLEAINSADLVVAGQSLGYLSVAQGKPTLFYNQSRVAPYETSGHVKSYEKYKWIDFPAQFEGMKSKDLHDFVQTPNSAVEEWKKLNIGEQFNPEKVLAVIESFL